MHDNLGNHVKHDTDSHPHERADTPSLQHLPCPTSTNRCKPYPMPKRLDYSDLRGVESHVYVEAVVLLAGLRQICRWLPSDKVAVSFVRKPSSDDREGCHGWLTRTDVRDSVGLKPVLRIEMTRDGCLLGCHSYPRWAGYCTHGLCRLALSQWFNGQSTTTRGSFSEVKFGHFQAVKALTRNISINHSSAVKTSTTSTLAPLRKTSSLEMFESGHGNLSPHRASGVAAIQDPAAQQAIRSHRERSSRSAMPCPEHAPLPPSDQLKQAPPSQVSIRVPLMASGI